MATKKRSQTFAPDGDVDQAAELLDFIDADNELDGTKLVNSDGYEISLPSRFKDVLRAALESYSEGLEIIVAPKHSVLSTQDTARLLGVSRPTVVRLAESGELPFTMRGKHRRIPLADALEYRDKMRVRRSEALDEMVRETEEAGGYGATLDFPPPTR